MFIPPSTNLTPAQLTLYLQAQPVTITSDYAEIIYFLRNGNLYRRVLLVVPDLQSSIAPALSTPKIPNQFYLPIYSPSGNPFQFQPSALGGNYVSWQGVNDLSARPAATGPNSNASSTALGQAQQTIVLNTLGNLTNRENRFAYSRFANDFFDVNSKLNNPDGVPDDLNGDNVPDLYPSLYPNVFNTGLIFAPNYAASANPTAINLLGFPFVFPGAYSKAQALASDSYGWIHAPAPYANASGTSVQFDTGGLAYLNGLNHNPLDIGDNLPTPANPPLLHGGQTEQGLLQTWWGFPTWRETVSPNWVDPTVQVNVGATLITGGANATPAQPAGLNPLSTGEISGGVVDNTGNVRTLLPAMTAAWRSLPQLFTDGYGDNNSNNFFSANTQLWSQGWEDDLIMTGVRSFDVKAYDNALANYADLGWGDDLRLYQPYANVSGAYNPTTPPFISGSGTPPVISWPPLNPQVNANTTTYNLITQTFAHEGRMPPLVNDNILDAQYPNPTYVNPNNFTAQYSAYSSYSSNVGDNNNGVVRLRRVWDSWSTDYSRAPATGVNNVAGSAGFPVGPPFSPPIYPSYPPPYAAPLRGIQIQVRVADPTNQRIKSLTIRQDFTDKL